VNEREAAQIYGVPMGAATAWCCGPRIRRTASTTSPSRSCPSSNAAGTEPASRNDIAGKSAGVL